MIRFISSLIASILIMIFGMINLIIWGSAILGMLFFVAYCISVSFIVRFFLVDMEEDYESN